MEKNKNMSLCLQKIKVELKILQHHAIIKECYEVVRVRNVEMKKKIIRRLNNSVDNTDFLG